MNYSNLFVRYGNIPAVSKDYYWRDRIFYSSRRYVLRTLYTKWIIPRYYRMSTYLSNQLASNIVISLTSFPKRLSTLWLVIESLKRQSVRPEKILLYLSSDEVVDKAHIPVSLLNEEDDLFEIRMRKGKLRAHGKYHFAMTEFPDKNVVTVDDDIIYAPFMLESLLKVHRIFPNDVITNNTCQMTFDKSGNLNSYTDWAQVDLKSCVDGYYSADNIIPMGVGGALYPPETLYRDVLNFELAKGLSYLADDLWLYAQTILAGKKVIKTPFNISCNIPIDIEDNVTLTSVNVYNNQNDVQLDQLRTYYKSTLGVDIVKSPI